MITRKQYLKKKPICKVTFRLPKQLAHGGSSAAIAGEFNQWGAEPIPMKTLKSGDYTVTLALASGREYQYRYLVDGSRWITDPDADKLVYCGFADCKNSVVMV